MFDRDEYYLNQNVIFLRRTVYDIENRLKDVEIKANYRVMSSENGYPVLYKNGTALSNSSNPIQENIRVFESVPQAKNNIYIICGLELGHILNFFADNCRGQIILFENNLETVKYTLSKVNLIKILAMPNVSFVTNEIELDSVLKNIKLLNNIEKTFVLANEYFSARFLIKFEYFSE